MKALIDKLEKDRALSRDEWIALIGGRSEALAQDLFRRASAVRRRCYGDEVYVRGLIEFTNCCKNCVTMLSPFLIYQQKMEKERSFSTCS